VFCTNGQQTKQTEVAGQLATGCPSKSYLYLLMPTMSRGVPAQSPTHSPSDSPESRTTSLVIVWYSWGMQISLICFQAEKFAPPCANKAPMGAAIWVHRKSSLRLLGMACSPVEKG